MARNPRIPASLATGCLGTEASPPPPRLMLKPWATVGQAGTAMQPDDGQMNCMNVSDTLARIVEKGLVAAMQRLELRLHLFMAASFFATLVPALFVLYKMQPAALQLLQLDRAQGEQRRARRRLQSAGAEGDTEVFEGGSGSSDCDGSPEHQPSAPSAPSRARRRNLPTRTASEIDLSARSGTRLLDSQLEGVFAPQPQPPITGPPCGA